MTTTIFTQKKANYAIILSLFMLFAGAFKSKAQDDTITVMGYNLLQYPGSTIGRADDYLKHILKYVKPDVFVVNELTNTTGANYILTNALNFDGAPSYEKASFAANNSLNNNAYYNEDKLELVEQYVISTSPRETDGYLFYVKDPNLAFHQDTVFFTVYVTHLKAGSTTSDESSRSSAATAIRNNLDGKSNIDNHFLIGDFNVYNSTEGAYTTFLGSGACQLYDPLNEAGIWHNNSDYELIHTQSTRTTSFGGGATGGMDDRFDFILCTNDIIQGSNRMEYVSGSYVALGNDGNHFNTALTAAPTNTLYPDSLVQDLYNMSDHLPVVARFAVDLPDGPSTGVGPCGDLFFTEYVEGSGNDRALEIINPTATTVDLSHYQLEFYPDGQTALTAGHTLALSGTLTAGDVYVIGAASAGSSITSVSDVTSSLLDSLLTGNDAVALVNTSSGDTLDIIGRIGQDPGASGWTVGGGSTADNTLIREDYIQNGSGNWTFSSSHWIVESSGFTDSLGNHYYYECDPENQCANPFISEYIRASGGNTAIEIYNPSANPVILDGQYQLRMYANGSTSYNYADLKGVIYPNDVFVIAPFTASLAGITGNVDQTESSFPGATFYTGDDAIALFRGFDTLDVVGQIGIDPGSSWPVTGTNGVNGATASYTLVRDSAVQAGQLDWSISASSEWVVYPNNTDTYIGFHVMETCAPAESVAKPVVGTTLVEGYTMQVYPNPAHDQLTLNLTMDNALKAELDAELYVTSTTGQVVWMSEINEFSKAGFYESIDVSHWPSGMYIVTIKSEYFKGISRKVMIAH